MLKTALSSQTLSTASYPSPRSGSPSSEPSSVSRFSADGSRTGHLCKSSCNPSTDLRLSSNHPSKPIFEVDRSASRSAFSQYQYSSPVTSPFYRHVLSPACDWICYRLVPRCVTPDQLSYTSLCCAAIATVASSSNRQVLAAVFWLLYSFLDNIDGKQARRLKLSTAGGEFLDHSCDSIVTSLSALMWINALVPDRNFPSNPNSSLLWTSTPPGPYTGIFLILASLNGQFPFFLSCCSSHVIGRVLLGGAHLGSAQDYFTVDEYNTLFLPGICLIRGFLPQIWDYQLLDAHYSMADGPLTVGASVALVMFAISLCCCTILSVQLISIANKDCLPLFPPGFAYLAIVWLLRPSFLLCIAPFACLCMELLLGKLRVETRWLHRRIWWPIGWLLLVALRFSVVTTRPFLLTHYAVCLCLLIWYKYKIHKAAMERSTKTDGASKEN